MNLIRTSTLYDVIITSYNEHQARKEKSNLAKAHDKQRSNDDPSFLYVAVDLQKVLQIPFARESLLYYYL